MSLRDFDLSRYDFVKTLPYMNERLIDNTTYDWLLATLSFLAILAILIIGRRWLQTRVHSLGRRFDAGVLAFVAQLLRDIWPIVLPLIALWFATRRLDFKPWLEKGIHYLVLGVVVLQVIKLIADLVGFIMNRSYLLSTRDDPAAVNTRKNITILVKALIWVGGILFLLDNFGFDVTAAVAGLGIGGIAIGLAAQSILGDTFSSFAISLDKPFEPGDFINVDAMSGTVEYVGLKTTRVRSLTGELLIFGNSDLTTSRIRNYKKMAERRINFKIGVEYSTTYDNLAALPQLLRETIESTDQTRFDRAHFFQYGDFALIFDVVYWVTCPEYNIYMDVQQEINLKIHRALKDRNVAMAFPTQTIHVATMASSATKDEVLPRS